MTVELPCHLQTWSLVKEQLCILKDISLSEDCDLKLLAETHQQVVNTSLGRQDFEPVSWGNCLFYGLVKFFRKHSSVEEKEKFLKDTFPYIIDLAVKIEGLAPEDGIPYSKQQQEKCTSLSRQLVASILACSFLCLFPGDNRGWGTKLNAINFRKFFGHLPIHSQNAKLRCILNYFDRVRQQWDCLKGNISYTRQVVKQEEMPTVDTWLNCNVDLCPVTVCEDGVIEDSGCEAVQVDFANRFIGGGVLGRGRVQEEIRFTVCPELIGSMLFMEAMEENEAIVIQGFEQFSATEGYASSLFYVGDYDDQSVRDTDGNLRNILCAIDAISYRHEGRTKNQYSDQSVLRDINKAFVGFCTQFEKPNLDDKRACEKGEINAKKAGDVSEEEYHTADESVVEDETDWTHIVSYAEDLIGRAITLAVPEAVEQLRHLSGVSVQSVSPVPELDEECANRTSSRIDGGDEGDMDHLEVNFRDWLAHYRRRSSNLSDVSSRRSSYDLASRRSSGSTRYSSEFSTDFEEFYDNFQHYEQKYKYHTIKEEVGSAVIHEFASNLVAGLLREGSMTACHLTPGVQNFHGVEPPEGATKPTPVKGSFDSEEEEDTERTIRNYVNKLFSEIWPFQDLETGITMRTAETDALRMRLIKSIESQDLNNLDVNLLSDQHNSELDTDGSENVVREISFESSKDSSTSTKDLKQDEPDESVLLDVANRLVFQAFREALDEYKQSLCQEQSSNIWCPSISVDSPVAKQHSVCSQSEHSSTSMDQSDSSSKLSHDGIVNDDAHVSDGTSANQIAEKVVTEIFESLPGQVGSICEPGAALDLDDKSTAVITSKRENTSQTSSFLGESESMEIFHDDSTNTNISSSSHGEKKDVEMYGRIADKILKQTFSTAIGDTAAICSPASTLPTPSVKIEIAPDQTGSDFHPNSAQSGLPEVKVIRSSDSFDQSDSSGKTDVSGSSPVKSDQSRSSSNGNKADQSASEESSSSQSKSDSGQIKHSQKLISGKIASQRRGRSVSMQVHVGQSRNFDFFANVLSRDLLTNAFLEVQRNPPGVSYLRRSSEPMHISNGAAMQQYAENTAQMKNGKPKPKSRTDEDLVQFEEELSRHGSTCDLGNNHRRPSGGFRDPLLSRFAEELIKANVTIPTFQFISSTNQSTSGSTRSCCSSISGFRDPDLAGFEEELLNTSLGRASTKTHASRPKSRNSGRLWKQKSQNYDSIDLRINSSKAMKSLSFDSQASGLSWPSFQSSSMNVSTEDVSEFADNLANKILQESLEIVMRMDSNQLPGKRTTSPSTKSITPLKPKPFDVHVYSNRLASSILQDAVQEAESCMVCLDWMERSEVKDHEPEEEEHGKDEHSGISEPEDLDVESSNIANQSMESQLSVPSSSEFEDALDIPYQRLEDYAEAVAAKVMVNSVAIMQREEECRLRRRYGRPIATGNWGCGAFGGDPHLKSLLQWMAASYAGTPLMLYYTFNSEKMSRFQDVIDTVRERNWNVASLMQAVRRYCLMACDQMEQHGQVSHDLFDVILFGEIFPGIT